MLCHLPRVGACSLTRAELGSPANLRWQGQGHLCRGACRHPISFPRECSTQCGEIWCVVKSLQTVRFTHVMDGAHSHVAALHTHFRRILSLPLVHRPKDALVATTTEEKARLLFVQQQEHREGEAVRAQPIMQHTISDYIASTTPELKTKTHVKTSVFSVFSKTSHCSLIGRFACSPTTNPPS